MPNVVLRPDLKTAGGEVSDILFKGQFVGSLTLVYREGDRISGSIQLEQEGLSNVEKTKVVDFLQDYVQSMIDALMVSECDVVVTYSSYDRIIGTETMEPSNWREMYSDDEAADEDNYDWIEEQPRFEDFDPSDRETLDMNGEFPFYELMIVGESEDKVEYHVYDKEQEWIAEAFLHIKGRDVFGDVNWLFNPSEEEIEYVTELIVSDFDQDEIDYFMIDMKFENEIIETVELAHEELAEVSESSADEFFPDKTYTIVMTRDDGEALTYEIYEQSGGGFPIGTATVDISQRQLSGVIDFREPNSTENMEQIAALLMQELDKEKDFQKINLTMLYKNEPIDEFLYETEQVH